MEEIYRHLAKTNLWRQPVFAEEASVTVTEVWHSKMTGAQTTIHRELQIISLRQQLFAFSYDIEGDPHDCILRVIYAHYGSLSNSKDNLPTTSLNQILDTFQLKFGFDFFTSSISNISRLPSTAENMQTFSFSYHPKLALIWSHDSTKATINSVCVVSNERKEHLKSLLERHWQLESHPMLLPFLCTLLLSSEIDAYQQKVKKHVQEVEVRTGYHQLKTMTEGPAMQELGEILAQLNGCATRLASHVRKLRMIDELNEFVLGSLDSKELDKKRPTSPSAQNEIDLLRHHMSLIQKRAKTQEVDNSYTLERVKTQISVISNIISQKDNLLSLQITRDSRLIAISSQHDSSSMKTLAIVTMVFLPGSFVANVFSMPTLNWGNENIEKIVNPRFRIYWAVTLPLTLLTFVLYGVWLLIRNRSRRDENSKVVERFYEVPRVAEVKKLIWERKDVLSSITGMGKT